MATEGLAGVGGESPESGKTMELTSDSRDRPHHGVELDRETLGWCDNPPRKIPYYHLNQSTLVIKR
jgi:hypothetical protein